MKVLILALSIGTLLYVGLSRSDPVNVVIGDQRRPDLAAIFTDGNYQQWIDQVGTVSRTAFDASGRRIGTQVGHAGGPNGIVVEMTYLEPDADHPLGQAFDGAGNPMPLHTGPGQGHETPVNRTQRAPLVS